MSATTELTELAEGVYAWIATGIETGTSNAGVVADTDGLTVIDTLMVRSQWEPFVNAIEKLDRPVARVVLTSGRVDCVGGSKQFPKAAVYSSAATSFQLEQPMPVDAYKRFFTDFADEFDDLAEIGTRAVTHEVVAPTQLTKRIELLTATGYTAGDLLALIPANNVLFTGGFCWFGITPLCFQGDPQRWADALDDVSALATTVVPGHGPIGGPEQVQDLKNYLRAIVAAQGDPTSIPAGPWDNWPHRERDIINVQRASMLAAGDDSMPPAMQSLIDLH